VTLTAAADHIRCELLLTDLRDLGPAVARCRRLLDLDADPVAVDALLGDDPALAPLIAAGPGRRVPRTVDGPELAMRAVLGQQISTAGARVLTRRLAEAAGTPVPAAFATGGLTHTFPTAEQVLELGDAMFPMPASRRDTLKAVAGAVVDGELDLHAGADRGAAEVALGAIRGVGPWTAATVAMRALGDPDAFPVGDLGVAGAARRLGLPAGRGLEARSQRWRPWRAYATQYLWSVLDHPINRTADQSNSREAPCRAS